MLSLLLSVIVNDLDAFWTCFSPPEANPPLFIDTDAVLARSITLQRLQSVTRRHSKIVEAYSRVQHDQLPQRDAQDPRVVGAHRFALPESFGVPVAERSDHIVRI